MATLTELADAEVEIQRIEIDLDNGKQPWRCLFATPDFQEWAGNVLPELETGIMQAEISPNEQVYALFADFIEGQHLEENRRFKPLRYHPELFVWELKTIDIRIFGWFAAMDMFICCFGELKDVLENPNETTRTYDRYIAKTNFARHTLSLDEPKFVNFKEYANVLSDAD